MELYVDKKDDSRFLIYDKEISDKYLFVIKKIGGCNFYYKFEEEIIRIEEYQFLFTKNTKTLIKKIIKNGIDSILNECKGCISYNECYPLIIKFSEVLNKEYRFLFNE